MTGSTTSTRDTGEFNGKRVLVTGGTKGAGRAIADRFLLAGGTVIITARSAPEGKTGAHFIQADLSTSEGTTKVIRELLDRFNGVDIMVHKVPLRNLGMQSGSVEAHADHADRPVQMASIPW
jgi:NAD(P)-dependent dehydrogenase (short-subunit alcohol dehydrogenase family)